MKRLEEVAQKFNVSMSEALKISKMTSFTTGVRQANTQLTNTAGILRTISRLTGVAFGAAGIRRFLSTLVDVTGQFEVQKMALGSMLQDADKADKIFGQFRQLALESPYTFQEFTKFGKQLTAFNIPAEQLVGTTKMLADVAAGLGVDMQRIILAYGQIKSAGVLKGTELRQLTEAGVPILDELAKQIEKTTGKTVQLAEVFDMISKKQIPFAMVEQAFKDMTSEGGKFYNMQEVLVETLAGKIGKLRDTWQQALYDIGSAQSGLLKGSVDFLTNIVANYDKLGRVIVELVATYGAYKAALFVTTLASRGYTAAQMASRAATLAAAAANRVLNTTMLANPYVAVAAAVTALAYGMYKLATHESLAEKTSRELEKAVAKTEVEAMKEVSALDKLSIKLESLSADTKEWKNAKSEVIQQFGKYRSDLDEEITRVQNLSSVYGDLKAKIAEAARVRMYQGFVDMQTKSLTSVSETALDKYINGIADRDISEGLKKELLGLVKSYVYEGQALTKSQTFALSMSGLAEYLNDARDAYTSLIGIDEQARKAFGITDKMLNDLKGDAAESDEVIKTLGNSVPEIVKEIKELERSISEDQKKAKSGIGLTDEQVKKIQTDEATLKKYKDLYKTLTGNDYDKKGAKVYKSERDTINTEIKLLQKYKDTYESLEGIIGAKGAKDITGRLYGITNFDFTSRIIDLANQLKTLGDVAGANSILSSLGLGDGKDIIRGLKQAQQTADSYKELIRSMTTEDTDIEGKGFWYDISKVASDLETKLNKLALQGQKAKEKLAGIDVNDENQKAAIFKALADEGWTEKEIATFWDKWIVGGRAAIDAFVSEASAKATSAARERVTDLAKVYVEDEFFAQGIDFDNISDKTLGQLRKLKQKLYDVMANMELKQSDRDILAAYGLDPENLTDVNLDEFFKSLEKDRGLILDDTTKRLLKLMQAAQKSGGAFDALSQKIKDIVEKRIKETGDETEKAYLKLGKFALDVFGNLKDSLLELVEISGNDGLGLLISDLEEVMGLTESVVKGFQQGDIVGAVVAGVSYMATGIVKAATETARFKKELAEAREEARKLEFSQSLLDGVKSIFGENNLREASNASEGIRKVSSAMKDLRENMPEEFSVKRNFWKRFFRGGGWFTGLATSQIGKYSKTSLQEMADSLGRDLYDEYGNLNAETLQAILDKYDKLKQSDKDWIQSAINNSEMYREAMEQLDGVISSIMGDITSSASSAIVNQWKTAGNAALDYADILDSVTTKYAEMAVQSLLLEDVFDDGMQKQLREAFKSGEMDKAMEIVASGMEAVAAMAPQIEQVLEPLRPYIKGNESANSENTLKAGINKEFVEGNSTLVASYMNAMRADLSVVRQMQTSGWQDVKLIRESIQAQSAPNYNEYMAQVAANTYDTARSNEEILARLKSVITASPSGGSAVRTAK